MNKTIVPIIVFLLFASAVTPTAYGIIDEPNQPDQPASGPGGSDYPHRSIGKFRYGYGGNSYWIFEPYCPKPESAPLIVFLHGFGGLQPIWYIEWIHHLVRRGNIVVYPRYQDGFFRGYDKYTTNALNAVKDAIVRLQRGPHVDPELDKIAVTGHSLGGSLTANIAALALEEGLPSPKAIMPVQPAIMSERYAERVDYSKIPASTLMVVVVGESDMAAGKGSAKIIFYNATQIALSNKDFVIQTTDIYGKPDIISNHLAPVCLPFFSSVDAMDYYSTWKLFDALTDYAFYGINKEYCLGDTPEQRFMGLWSDGIPVKELIVTDYP
jgi:pimeloyl-ACP methyl ester carboxylesterase